MTAAGADTIDFAAALQQSPNPYVVLDPELTIVWMNEAYLRVTMRGRGDILGRNIFVAFPSPPDSDSRRQLQDSFDRVLATGEADEIALIRYDIPGPDGTVETRYWSATHTPFPGPDGRVRYILQHTVDVTELESLRRLSDGKGLVERARQVERRSQGLSREVHRLRNLVEQAPGFVAIVSGEDHRFVLANAAYRRLVGERDIVGKPVAEALPEVVDQGFVTLLDEVARAGEPYFGRRERVVLDNADGGQATAYLEFVYQPIRTEGASGVFVQGHDVTEEVEAEERQRLLINELNHRVKNTLAIVQGLAQQSFGKHADGRFEIFGARLAALAGAHNLLTEATWESADLRDLVYSSLEATAGIDIARCELSGEPLTLPPTLALSLAMIIHELSTNAIKYGALSNADGVVRVIWSSQPAEDGCAVTIDWEESGGPPVVEPEREGFGTRLIRRGLAGKGSTRLEYRPEGLHCRVEVRL